MLCGAKTRSGGTCQSLPMLGKKRCRMHGGSTPVGMANPNFKHGAYSKHLVSRWAAGMSLRSELDAGLTFDQWLAEYVASGPKRRQATPAAE